MCEQLTFRPYPPPVDLEDLKKKIEEIKAKPVWKPEFPNYATLVLTVQVFRDYGNGWVDVCDDDGNCLKVSKKTLQKPILEYLNEEQRMKQMKDSVLTVAKDLLKANNTVTTLEIKQVLRRDYPYYYWTQQVVSDYMAQFAGDGIFTFVDNGTYRIYSLATPATVAVTAGPVSASLSGISKVAGTIPVKGKRGRPKKTSANMSRSTAASYIVRGDFDSMDINGVIVTPAQIKLQKKSPKGYLTTNKLNNLVSITLAGSTYNVF